jgi:polysaccharide export outer membrane protein
MRQAFEKQSAISEHGRRSAVAVLAAVVAFVPVAARAQQPAPPAQQPAPPAQQPAPRAQQPTPAAPAAAAPRPETGDYRIGAGDMLQLFVWKEPDLTREVTVRIDGKISVALLGDVQAAGRSTGELADEVARGLARFVSTPVVTIAVNQPRSTRFFVLGMVGRAGEFPMTSPTTVVQALAVAGGLREYAKSDAIVIVRQEGGKSTFVPVNLKRLVGDRDGSQNIPLRSGDTILVP